jgi:hypothetical protein
LLLLLGVTDATREEEPLLLTVEKVRKTV